MLQPFLLYTLSGARVLEYKFDRKNVAIFIHWPINNSFFHIVLYIIKSFGKVCVSGNMFFSRLRPIYAISTELAYIQFRILYM